MDASTQWTEPGSNTSSSSQAAAMMDERGNIVPTQASSASTSQHHTNAMGGNVTISNAEEARSWPAPSSSLSHQGSDSRQAAHDVEQASPMSISPEVSRTTIASSIAPEAAYGMGGPAAAAATDPPPAAGSESTTSAASMLETAAQAGLQTVSSALAAQAQSISTSITTPSTEDAGKDTGISMATRALGESLRASEGDLPQSIHPRQASSSEHYSQAMTAHISSALRGAQQLSASTPPVSSGSSSTATPTVTTQATTAAQSQMAEIATRTASEEAERQMRLHAILQAAKREDGADARRPCRGSSSTAAAAAASTAETAPEKAYFEFVGLGHIPMPSSGLEQPWGRDSARGVDDGESVHGKASASEGKQRLAPARYYDASDAMAGVPSLPLLPGPSPIMIPPEEGLARSFNLPLPGHKKLSSTFAPSGGLGRPSAVVVESSGSSPRSATGRKLAFEVIQTPGGTARAGWWMSSEAPGQTQTAPAAAQDAGVALPSTEHAGSQPHSYFEARHTLEPEAFAALATQAAYATSLLTTTIVPTSSTAIVGQEPAADQSGDPLSSTNGQARWQSLSTEQQELIATQLRAWAGLHGPAEQEAAWHALEQRKQHLNHSSTSAPATTTRTAMAESTQLVSAGLANAAEVTQAAAFFPPDFAAHFRSQLSSLTRGYYQQLYEESSRREHYADEISENQTRAAPAVTQQEESPLNAALAEQDPDFRSESQYALVSEQIAALKATSGFTTLDKEQSAAVAVRTLTLGVPAQSVAVVVVNAAQPPMPVPSSQSQDPLQLLGAASSATGADATSDIVLEHLLRFAHTLYQSGGQDEQTEDGQTVRKLHPTLLPLLHTLQELHPQHLPTLLLLSCAYYSTRDLPASLFWNDRILSIDPRYVEAMSNIGTTLRSLGRFKEAESWWTKAVRLRPSYWDAYENLLGVLCAPQQQSQGQGSDAAANVQPRWAEALRLCEHVEAHVLGRRSIADGRARKLPIRDDRPLQLPRHLTSGSVPRLQQLLYAKGNLKYALSENVAPSAQEYMRAIELVISPIDEQPCTCRDAVVAVCVAGLVSMGVMLPESAVAGAAAELMQTLGLDTSNEEVMRRATAGQWSHIAPGGLLQLVHNAGQNIINAMLRLGGGSLPMLMLLPEAAMRITYQLFDEYQGQLPSMAVARKLHREAANPKAMQQANQTTSTIFLTLARLFQDATANPASSQNSPLTLDGIPLSTSLLLPLYYLALALHPSASTCNNLGILLSGLPIVTTIADSSGNAQNINGQGMAMCYYQAGITMDPNHPHLYTNLGSLLKDLGHLKEAIANYQRAVTLHPTFDVALANLGNSLRDAGRTEEALPYYRRALAANPTAQMPEAMCGLLNGLLSLSDWNEAFAPGGLLSQTCALVERQLKDGSKYGAGALQASNGLDKWLQLALTSINDHREATQVAWYERLAPFFVALDRESLSINEGGFVIRMIEHLHKRSQRRWYRDHYITGEASTRIRPTQQDEAKYPTLRLPSALVPPTVPTVLPFHTFSYGIEGFMSPRALRLISHRNGLRISQSSLSQPWLPAHVFPPPPPPSPKVKVGYVSSDFNNHPLAHLMQSVFGMHDLERFDVYLYATAPSDNSPYRRKIESEAQNFHDVSGFSTAQMIDRILHDGIHILINLNGYTKGGRNEVFAARPCPLQMQFMGFAGGMASGWTDYTLVDPIVCPPEVTSVKVLGNQERPKRITDLPGEPDPEEPRDDWVYTERFLYMPDSYFVNDHKQGFREPETRPSDVHGGIVRPHEMSHEEAWLEEEERRWKARKELFPGLPDDYIVFATFNQIYKIEPVVFQAWMQLLQRVPNSILWLLRFPAAGEPNILRTARQWAGDEVCSRIVFTDVAPKDEHIRRGRVADLFLDTFEVNAHTTACDCLWSGTPILTLPKWKYKQASLVAASIARATGYGDQMIVNSVQEYIDRAVQLAESVHYQYQDANGQILPASSEPGATIKASQLRRVGASAKAASQAQAEAKAAQSTVSQEQTQGASTSTVAAPITAAAQDNTSSEAARHEAARAAVTPNLELVSLQIGAQAPAQTFVRRGSGELVELRRNLFLNRDTMPLFDTTRWVRDLERGYVEAWRRWSLGVDIEGSPEWDALATDEERRRSSGHIYVADLPA